MVLPYNLGMTLRVTQHRRDLGQLIFFWRIVSVCCCFGIDVLPSVLHLVLFLIQASDLLSRQAEPYNTPKAMLSRAMLALLTLANANGASAAAAAAPPVAAPPLAAAAAEPALSSPLLQTLTLLTGGSAPSAAAAAGSSISQPPSLASLLDSEPWARVHAFNCLRHIFNDSNLTVDTSGYFAEGIQVQKGRGGARGGIRSARVQWDNHTRGTVRLGFTSYTVSSSSSPPA